MHFVWTLENNTYTKLKIIKEENEYLISEDNTKHKITETFPVNPAHFDYVKDLSNLSYLNEPSILYTLENRYKENKIYTRSGPFLISVNPYKEISVGKANLYSDEIKKMILKEKFDQPHVYQLVDRAHRLLTETGESQTILITGESGAGKTENTKKALEYLIWLNEKAVEDKENLINKIKHSNIILEAYGNAKTVKNDNSSRFGKFIQIFYEEGKIKKCQINKYLLEKSRVTNINENELNFHIFYYTVKMINKEILRKIEETEDYEDLLILISKSMLVEKTEDFAFVLDYFPCLNAKGGVQMDFFDLDSLLQAFDQFEINHISFFNRIIGLMFLSKCIGPGPEALGPKTSKYLKIASHFLGLDHTSLHSLIFSPNLRAGRDVVRFERNPEQLAKIIEGIQRSIYEIEFDCLIRQINRKMAGDVDSSALRFIGFLDIAGFEVFDFNSFEQLLINYTNEKLQQFFNTFMFKEEQRIYSQENISWEYIDFGMDLQPTIQALEGDSPVGILRYTDEECFMPGADDQRLYNKIISIASPLISPVKLKQNTFSLRHYAGSVSYTVKSWIEKNKDITSNEIDLLLKNKSHKKGIFKTISYSYSRNLNSLLDLLRSSRPHFIRCILPNLKKHNLFSSPFVLGQLKCNGVLEGLRISRIGYPTKIKKDLFIKRFRYRLGAQAVPDASKDSLVLDIIKSFSLSNPKSFIIGKSLILFKQGVMASLESDREAFINTLFTTINHVLRYRVNLYIKNNDLRLSEIRAGLVSDVKNSIVFDRWWKLFLKIKPMLEVRKNLANLNKMKEHEEKINLLNEDLKKMGEVQNDNEKLREEIFSLKKSLKAKNKTIEKLKSFNFDNENKFNLIFNKISAFTFKNDKLEEILCKYREKQAQAKKYKEDFVYANNKNLSLISLLEINKEKLREIKLQNEKNVNLIKSLLNLFNNCRFQYSNLLNSISTQKILNDKLYNNEVIIKNNIKLFFNNFNKIKININDINNLIINIINYLNYIKNNSSSYKSKINSELLKINNLVENININKLILKFNAHKRNLININNVLIDINNVDISKISKFKESLNKYVKSKSQVLNKYKNEIIDMNLIIDNINKELCEKNNKIKALEKDQEENKEKLNEYINSFNEIEIRHSSLQDDNNFLKTKNEKLNEKINEIIKNTAQEEDQSLHIEKMNTKISKLNNLIAKLKIEKDSLYKENIKINENKINEMIKFEEEKNRIKKSYSIEINKLKNDIEKLTESETSDENNTSVINSLEITALELTKKIKNYEFNFSKIEILREEIRKTKRVFLEKIYSHITKKDEFYDNLVNFYENEFENYKNDFLNKFNTRENEVKELKMEYKRKIALINENIDKMKDFISSNNFINEKINVIKIEDNEILKLKIKQLEKKNKEKSEIKKYFKNVMEEDLELERCEKIIYSETKE